ncbi:hypothetical protein NA57DRAFT_76843 [Rhizodiscina lignyota]|uniref:Uncharacterized protein n=1 Tax=Rhizodiscina lignyota TaxID=1504668 RepID=A0A9P4IA42_9PEZI|nr:hypothetical protein NA57DRAFT_76843 [Rhizodiscina lignyota]
MSQQTTKRVILTGAIAAITIVGAYTGATIKTDNEKQTTRKKFEEATPEQMIEQLERAKSQLLYQRGELEKKIRQLHERQKARNTSGSES